MGKGKLLPVRNCPFLLEKHPGIQEVYTPYVQLLYTQKLTLLQFFSEEKDLHFLPLTERKKEASIFGNLLFNKWRESGCDFNSFHPDLQFLNKFPAPSSKQPVSVTPLAKSKEE